MVFSSLSFTIAFIPIVIILYFLLKTRQDRNILLVFASLIFYAWGEPKFVLIMLGVTFMTFYAGIFINNAIGNKKLISAISVIAILAPLFVFKYLNFVCGAEIVKAELPIGISFYTFQALSYVIDLYRGEIELQEDFFDLLMYISFFPQLIAGPVVRYSTVQTEIKFRVENLEDIEEGIEKFAIGLSKKVLLANYLSKFAEIVYTSNHGSYDTAVYWLASLAYTLEIYYDFSGYSDMAIGLGRIFGFHFLENFNYPYASTSVTEFWRRWHISLSSWFRDYVYIPLGGSRVNAFRYVFNIIIVWALTGLWHGAAVNFVLWGLYYAVLLIIEKLFLGKILEKLPKLFSWIYTMFVVNLGWVLFNLVDLEECKYALSMMFSKVSYNFLDMVSLDAHLLSTALFIPLGLLLMFPKKFKLPRFIYVLLIVVCVIVLLSSSYNPFIYFRF